MATRVGPVLIGVVLLAAQPVPTQAADEAESGAVVGAGHGARQPARHGESALDDRVRLMAKELALQPAQQSQLRDILQSQRVDVARVWSDPSLPAAVRVGATQSVAEKTAERIRAILSDEQREKYMKSHQHDAPVGAPAGDVQQWMKAGRGMERPSEAASAVAKGS